MDEDDKTQGHTKKGPAMVLDREYFREIKGKELSRFDFLAMWVREGATQGPLALIAVSGLISVICCVVANMIPLVPYITIGFIVAITTGAVLVEAHVRKKKR